MEKQYHFRFNRFYPVYPEAGSALNLSEGENNLFSFFYNWVNNFGDGGFCGFSNAKIAAFLGISERCVCKRIKLLREKNLIKIQNTGRPQRRIYLNMDLLDQVLSDYLNPVEDRSKADLEQEIAELKAENASLRAQLSSQTQYQQPQSAPIKPDPVADSPYLEYLQPFFDLVDLSDDQKKDIMQSYAPFAYTFMTQEGLNELESHFRYMAKQINSRPDKAKSIKTLSAYLRKALKQRAEQLAERRRIKIEKPDSHKKPQEELNLPDWYNIIPDEEATAEDLAAVLALQEQVLHRKE